MKISGMMKRTERAKRMERTLTTYHNNDNIMIEKGGGLMPKIKPISDLRNNFTEISRIVHEGNEPVFLTKNGYGDMVVMSVEQYEAFRAEKRIDSALLEAQRQAGTDSTRFDFDDVSVKLRKKLADKVSKSDA